MHGWRIPVGTHCLTIRAWLLDHHPQQPGLRSARSGDLDCRPSIDGDRKMTSEVPPNEASPRETSASQAALASCLARPPGGLAPSLFVSYLCVSVFCLRRHRARFYRARYRRRPFAVINLNSLNSTSSRCGMLLVATRGSAETKLTEFSQQYTDVRKIFTPLWAPQTSRLCRHRFAGFRPTTEPSGRQGIKANPTTPSRRTSTKEYDLCDADA